MHKSLISADCCICVFIVHEGTLVHAASVLSQWTGRLTVNVPSELREWFKKAFGLKTSTSLVRQAYLQAMIGAFKGQSDCWDVSHGFILVLLMFCQNKQRLCVFILFRWHSQSGCWLPTSPHPDCGESCCPEYPACTAVWGRECLCAALSAVCARLCVWWAFTLAIFPSIYFYAHYGTLHKKAGMKCHQL